MNILSVILPLIYLFLDLYIYKTSLSMLDSNYQCKCGQTWQLKQLSDVIFTIISLQVSLIVIALILTSLNTISNMYVLKGLILFVGLIGLALMGLQIYYIYLMITYVNDLKKNNCLCVDKTYSDTLFYYGWVKIIFTVLLFIMAIVNIMKQPVHSDHELKEMKSLLKKSLKHQSKTSKSSH
jgi:hypothetical protein